MSDSLAHQYGPPIGREILHILTEVAGAAVLPCNAASTIGCPRQELNVREPNPIIDRLKKGFFRKQKFSPVFLRFGRLRHFPALPIARKAELSSQSEARTYVFIAKRE